jgi:hypothetical protein
MMDSNTYMIMLLILVVVFLTIGGYFVFKYFTQGKKNNEPSTADDKKQPKQKRQLSAEDDDESELLSAEDDDESELSAEDESELLSAEDESEREPVVVPVSEEDTPVVNKQMCFYTNVYEICDTQCGAGKRFRKQVTHTPEMNVRSYGIKPDDLVLHVCKEDNAREFRPCEGTNCSDEFTFSKFKENNPDIPVSDRMTQYCEFIDANDACNDPNVRNIGACRDKCITKWR